MGEMDKVLILAWHPACLLPVFGEAALLRLARLAASQKREVEIWASPEIAAGSGGLRGRLPTGVAWQVRETASLPQEVARKCSNPGKAIGLIPGHSVWDRTSFTAALNGSDPSGRCRRCGPADETVAGSVQDWMAEAGSREARGAAGLPALVFSPGQAREAEARLVAALAARARASDSFMSRRVDRHVSLQLSPPLARVRVAPNLITLAGTAIGCAGAWLLAQTGYWAHLAGALLFLAAVVVDGVDGEVARLALRESTFGHYLDILTDNLVHLAVFAGMAVGLYRASGSVAHLYALAALLVGFALCAVAVFFALERPGASQAAWHPLVEHITRTLNSRDFAYLIVLLALINRLAWFLWGAAVGTYVVALGLALLPVYYRSPKNRPG